MRHLLFGDHRLYADYWISSIPRIKLELLRQEDSLGLVLKILMQLVESSNHNIFEKTAHEFSQIEIYSKRGPRKCFL